MGSVAHLLAMAAPRLRGAPSAVRSM